MLGEIPILNWVCCLLGDNEPLFSCCWLSLTILPRDKTTSRNSALKFVCKQWKSNKTITIKYKVQNINGRLWEDKIRSLHHYCSAIQNPVFVHIDGILIIKKIRISIEVTHMVSFMEEKILCKETICFPISASLIPSTHFSIP